MASCVDSNQSRFPAIDLGPHTLLGQHRILGGEPPDDPNTTQPEPVYDNPESMFPRLLGWDSPATERDERLDSVPGAERHEWNERNEADSGWQRPCRVEDC